MAFKLWFVVSSSQIFDSFFIALYYKVKTFNIFEVEEESFAYPYEVPMKAKSESTATWFQKEGQLSFN